MPDWLILVYSVQWLRRYLFINEEVYFNEVIGFNKFLQTIIFTSVIYYNYIVIGVMAWK
jgi:hypothetical protein